MKKFFSFLFAAFLLHVGAFAQSVGINNTGLAPDPAAMLDVSSSTKGLLIPRMTQAQRLAITPVPLALMVYQTDAVQGFYYNASSLPGTPNWYHLIQPQEQYWTKTLSGDNLFNANTGFIGIGTSTPGYKLDVNGRLRLRYNSASAGLWLNKQSNVTPSVFIGNYDDSTFGIYNNESGWKFFFDHKNSNLGIQNPQPLVPLSFPAAIGKKISLYPGNTGDVGMGVFPNEFRLHADNPNADMTFGYDNYTLGFTERMRIKGNGNVGIGLSNPSFPLTVQSGGQGITQQSPDGTTQVGFYTSSGFAYLQTYSNHNLSFSTHNGSQQMVLSTAGNLGIGTATPAYKLDVFGRMRLAYNGESAGMWLNKQDNSAEAVFAGNLNDSIYGFYGAGSGWQFFFNHQNGKMGIGNSNPRVGLSFPAVVGKKISLYPGSTGDAGMGVFGNEFRLHSDYSGADITFGYDNYNIGFTERMRVKGDGRVCIGTTTPATGYLLSVNGKIIAQEMRVQLKSNWPDYVFRKDYRRMSLNELENYVSTNNHLPGFEPAAVVEKDGADVGETQRKLLEKVEELTLHLIDMNKRIEKLEAENTILKQQKQ